MQCLTLRIKDSSLRRHVGKPLETIKFTGFASPVTLCWEWRACGATLIKTQRIEDEVFFNAAAQLNQKPRLGRKNVKQEFYVGAKAVQLIDASRKNYDAQLRRVSGNRDRYYDPTTGRYVTSDPIRLNGGLNTFGYVYQNPLFWSDFFGLQTDIIWVSPIWGMPGDRELRDALRDTTPPEGSISLGAHGASDTIQTADGTNLTPSQVAAEILGLPNYSPDKPIYLYVCNVAEGDDSFASDINDILPNPVFGPEALISPTGNGNWSVPPSKWRGFK